MSEAPAQLRMGFTRFDHLEAPIAPVGYQLRTYRPGDEEAWLEILSHGEFGVWDQARLDRFLSGDRAPVPRDGIFFLTQNDRPIGTACTCLFRDMERGEFSELGWVAVHPEHRGQGLARTVCQAVLGYARDRGHTYSFLLTEHFRPAAIKTYLRLGFEPEMTHPSHKGWWDSFRATMDQQSLAK